MTTENEEVTQNPGSEDTPRGRPFYEIAKLLAGGAISWGQLLK
jgi:hypothetical protein